MASDTLLVRQPHRTLDAACAPLDLHVWRGLERPLVEEPHPCPQIHGHDAIGDLSPPLSATTRAAGAGHAVQRLLEALRSAPAPITIVALAPLSNLGVAIRLDPELCRRKIRRVVWMGGSAFAGGNCTAWAEANAAYDPEACHIVLTSGIPISMYTWDA